jgi:hypothetical protein
LVLRVQETAGRPATAVLTWLGQTLPLGTVPPHGLVSWRLTPDTVGGWQATRCTLCEDAG